MRDDFARHEFKISYSRLNSFLFCPYKYKLIYVDDMRAPINADISFGHSIHNALEKFHSQRSKDFRALHACYIDTWKNEGFDTPTQCYEYYLRGKKILENYFESFKSADVQILFNEKKFETNIAKYKFVGIIDRIDRHPNGDYEVMDYKTHAKVWEQERVDKDLQLSLYAYACKTVLGFNPNIISVYFLSQNKKIYTARPPEQIQECINLSVEIAQKIVAEDFEPNTQKCPVCDFKNRCKYCKAVLT